MSLNALINPPLSSSSSSSRFNNDSLFSIPRQFPITQRQHQHHHRHVLVVEARNHMAKKLSSKKRSPSPPPLPKIEDDGNPKFVVFIRMANLYPWYPLEDNFLGKFIYKDTTFDQDLAAFIYQVRFFPLIFFN